MQTKRIVSLIIVAVLLTITILGAQYYLQSAGERLRNPQHDWFRSSGYLGQSAGILAFLGFAFLWLYPLRKRFRKALAFTGAVPKWLGVHIMVGIFLPWVALIHAGWRMSGLAGIALGAMIIVWVSGIIGRYIYTRMPRSRDGLEMGMDAINGQRRELTLRVSATTGLPPEDVEAVLGTATRDRKQAGILRSIAQMVVDDLSRPRTVRRFQQELQKRSPGKTLDKNALAEAARFTRQQIALEQQLRMLESTRRLFRFWHVAHLPVAITAVIAVVVHVTVVIALGTTWLR
jgi:hypothetical protein